MQIAKLANGNKIHMYTKQNKFSTIIIYYFTADN